LNEWFPRASPTQIASKQAAAAATQTIAAAQNAAASNKNTASHQQLVHSCKVRTQRTYTHTDLTPVTLC